MILLALDTAGPVVGVAARRGARTAVRTARVTRDAEALLLPWAQDVCAEVGGALSDVGVVAVTVGPGTFTGLRVGMATAVGLSLSLGVPLVAADALVHRGRRVEAPAVLSLLDARKQRVYASLLVDGRVVEGPADVPPADAVAWVSARGLGDFVATGEGAVVYADVVRAAGGRVADDADDPSLAALLDHAADALSRGDTVDALHLTPRYIRPPDARPRAGGTS